MYDKKVVSEYYVDRIDSDGVIRKVKEFLIRDHKFLVPDKYYTVTEPGSLYGQPITFTARDALEIHDRRNETKFELVKLEEVKFKPVKLKSTSWYDSLDEI